MTDSGSPGVHLGPVAATRAIAPGASGPADTSANGVAFAAKRTSNASAVVRPVFATKAT